MKYTELDEWLARVEPAPSSEGLLGIYLLVLGALCILVFKLF